MVRRSRPAWRLPARHPAGGGRGSGAEGGRPDTAQVPGAAARRDCQAGHDRGAAPRHQARRARPRPVLRHTFARQRASQGPLRAEPLHRDPTASLQPRRNAAGARHRALHQRPAGRHLRAEEQPHQADGGRRGLAVQEGPQSARETVRAWPLHRPLRGGRGRGAFLHPSQGQVVVVPALQPRLERRRGQSAQSERHQDRLPVARGADPRAPDAHPGELRSGSGIQGRANRPGRREPRSGRATTSSTWCAGCSPTPPRRVRAGAT